MDPLGPWNLRRLAQCFPRPPKRPARDPPRGGANLASPRPPKTHSWDWKSLSRIPPVGPDRSESATSRRRDANDTIVQSDDVSSHCAAKWCLQSRGGNRETRDDHDQRYQRYLHPMKLKLHALHMASQCLRGRGYSCLVENSTSSG